MDCKKAEELFEPFLLGALDGRQRRRMESHLGSCPACSTRLPGDGETVTRLAFSVPQLAVPPVVEEHLFSRIDADNRRGLPARVWRRLAVFKPSLVPGAPIQASFALAAVVIVGLVWGGIWFNGRLNQISVDNEQLNAQVETMVEEDAQVKKMVNDQRYLTSMTAAPGVSVNMLWGTKQSLKAWGMIACCAVSDTGMVALLAVLNLPPLPGDKVYQVWLVKGEQRHSAGLFTVDSTGYAQTVIIPVAPMAEFDAIGITVEPIGGSPDPTGTGVLRGDL